MKHPINDLSLINACAHLNNWIGNHKNKERINIIELEYMINTYLEQRIEREKDEDLPF